MSSIHPGPGIAKVLPPLPPGASGMPMTPAELKAYAIKILPHTGLSRRMCWKTYEGGAWGWSTIRAYFDADCPKDYPSERFVRWLHHRMLINVSAAAAREFEVAQ